MYYDSVRDPIKKYFLEKIQICASSKNALQIISEKDEDVIKKKSKDSDDESSENEDKTEEIAALEDKLKKLKTNARERRYSMNTQKKIRSKQVQMDIQTHNQQKESQADLPSMVNKHMEAAGTNDDMVKKSLNSQAERIRQKLERRRMNSFQKCSLLLP